MKTVPQKDTLCRLIDPGHWSHDDDRPSYIAFSASRKKLSTWHRERVTQNHSTLEDLCFDSLEGFGEAELSTQEFTLAANESRSPDFQTEAVWRPEEVEPPWLRWQNAHVNIESQVGNSSFPKDYRLLLAMRCAVTRRPNGV